MFKGEFQSGERELLDIYIAQDEIPQDGSLLMNLVVKAPKQIEVTVLYFDYGFGSTHQLKNFVLLETDSIFKVKQLSGEETGVEVDRFAVYELRDINSRLEDSELMWKTDCRDFIVKRIIKIIVYDDNELFREGIPDCYTYRSLLEWKQAKEGTLHRLSGRWYDLRARPNPTLLKTTDLHKHSPREQILIDDIVFDVRVENKCCSLL